MDRGRVVKIHNELLWLQFYLRRAQKVPAGTGGHGRVHGHKLSSSTSTQQVSTNTQHAGSQSDRAVVTRQEMGCPSGSLVRPSTFVNNSLEFLQHSL